MFSLCCCVVLPYRGNRRQFPFHNIHVPFPIPFPFKVAMLVMQDLHENTEHSIKPIENGKHSTPCTSVRGGE